MKTTPYGICIFLGALIGLSLVCNIKYTYVGLLLLSVFLQSFLTKISNKTYNMSGYITVIPILFYIFIPCKEIRELLVAFSVALAIGRIGCYYAGCCTGKEKENFIVYEGDYSVNKKLNKKYVDVQPTIILEIVLQFLIVFIVYKADYAPFWFGILNALLIMGTNNWRLEKRMEDGNHRLPIISLTIYALLSLYSCGKVPKLKLKFTPKIWKAIVAFILSIIVSNDYNVVHIEKKINSFNNYLK